jgi:hypothetical protein
MKIWSIAEAAWFFPLLVRRSMYGNVAQPTTLLIYGVLFPELMNMVVFLQA